MSKFQSITQRICSMVLALLAVALVASLGACVYEGGGGRWHEGGGWREGGQHGGGEHGGGERR